MTSHNRWVETLRYHAEGVAEIQQVEIYAPIPERFAIFLNTPRRCSLRYRLESCARLNHLLACMGVVDTPEYPRELLGYWDHHAVLEEIPDDNVVEISRITEDGILEGTSDNLDEFRYSVTDLEDARNQIPEECRPQSLLVPLLQGWMPELRRRPMVPERRITRILPEPVRDAVSTKTQLPVSTGVRFPKLGRHPDGAGYLPGLEPPAGVVVPGLPLEVAEASTTGAGAPITPRLWFGCQMALSLDRRTGENEVLAFTLRDVRDWLWPNGWNKKRDLPRLIEGLRNLSTMGIVWERREWLLVRPIAIPTMDAKLDDSLLVDVTALPGSDRGPMIDTKALWGLGAKGAVPWRMWIRLAYLWDSAKLRNGGHRIHATRPEVRRGPGGVIVNRRGEPVLTKAGKPVRNWNYSKAVRTGNSERNPQADRIPPLGMRDLALLGFDNSSVTEGTVRWRAKQARKWLSEMERMGLVVLEQVGRNKVRVLEPYRGLETAAE